MKLNEIITKYIYNNNIEDNVKYMGGVGNSYKVVMEDNLEALKLAKMVKKYLPKVSISFGKNNQFKTLFFN